METHATLLLLESVFLITEMMRSCITSETATKVESAFPIAKTLRALYHIRDSYQGGTH